MSSYYYGNPDKANSWEYAASIFAAHESVNSEKTSSLPLVQFWKPTRNGDVAKHAQAFLDRYELPGDLRNADFCFEYPVPVKKGCRGKASMTDLMILSESCVVAIEAKWTECCEPYESIQNWLKHGNSENHEKVLDGWLSYINDYLGKRESKFILNRTNLKEGKIPYQMLHRIASACAVASGTEGRARAVVIYQLFYDDDTREKMESFAQMLNDSYGALFPYANMMHFFVNKVKVVIKEKAEIEKIANRACHDKSAFNDIFILMQDKEVYDFSLSD